MLGVTKMSLFREDMDMDSGVLSIVEIPMRAALIVANLLLLETDSMVTTKRTMSRSLSTTAKKNVLS
jgi:hypothetical protein